MWLFLMVRLSGTLGFTLRRHQARRVNITLIGLRLSAALRLLKNTAELPKVLLQASC